MEWQPIETAPYGVSVEVKVEGGKSFPATLVRDGSMNDSERTCDQWQADTDAYPRCWSDGCCWESNANEVTSKQPVLWRHLPSKVDLP